MLSTTQGAALQAAGPDWEKAAIEPAITVLASPSWWGADADLWRLRTAQSEATCLVKVMDPETAAYSDVATAFRAAQQAASVGVGPAVIAADSDERTLVMEDLSPARQWSTGTLDRLLDRDIRLAVLDARKRFQQSAPLGRTVSVFDHAEELLDKCLTESAPLPPDVRWLAANLRQARDAILASGVDQVPAHGDGNVSNVMISAAGDVKLVDWDLAGDMDPFEDLGSFLVEAHDCESDAVESFVAFFGSYNGPLFNRAWLYGIADDFRWGLIGALMAATSRRETYEFLKFGNWRFLRARMAIRDPRFSEKLGRL